MTQPPPGPPPYGPPPHGPPPYGPPPYGPPPYGPPPGPPARGRIRGTRVATGIGIALAAHGLTIAAMVVGVATDNSEYAFGAGLIAMLVGQAVVFLACLIVGVVLIARQESGIGVGLLIGWAVGVLVAPVVGFGLCVWMLNGSSP